MRHLKGLDTLRAVAALAVVFDHTEIIRQRRGFHNLIDDPVLIFPDSHLSVMLFFIISGFLITYLLLNEVRGTGGIHLKNFYMRRILRIWPLYYLILIVSYLIFSPAYSPGRILLSALMMPNVGYALQLGWDVSPQIWSLGAEEQFYLFWPPLLLLLLRKNFIRRTCILIAAFTALPYTFKLANFVFFHSEEIYTVVSRFFYGTKFNSLLMGALVGYLFFNKKNTVAHPHRRILTFILTLVPFILWFFKFQVAHFNDELYSIMFAFSTYHIVADPAIKIENPVTRFIGKISYGIYIYHWIIIELLSDMLTKFGVMDNGLLLHVSVFAVTIGISWISYITFERFFLNQKKKFV